MTFCSVVMSDTPAPLGRGCEVADGCDYAPLRHTGHLSSVIVKVSDEILAIPNKRKGSALFPVMLVSWPEMQIFSAKVRSSTDGHANRMFDESRYSLGFTHLDC